MTTRVRVLLVALLAVGALTSWVPGARAADRLVEGCVTAPAGLPAGLGLVFERTGETRSVPVSSTGCFHTELAEARWTIRVDLPEGVRLRLLTPELTRFAPERSVIDILPEWAVGEQRLVLTDQAELSGRVTDDAGAPLSPDVRIVSTDGGSNYNAHRGADGTWWALVAPGEYRIGFEPVDDRWMSRWLGGAETPPFTYGDLTGQRVSVDPAQAVGGLDAVLSRTATVSGRLTDSQGRPLAGVGVQLWKGRLGSTVARATTGPDGRYAVEHLPPGGYSVYFATTRTVPTFHGGADLATEAEVVRVEAGAVLTGIDGVSLVGGAISGRVIDAQGHPVPGIQLTAIGGTMPNITPELEAYTREDGTFDSGHVLRPGTFMLRAMGSVFSDWQPTVLRIGSAPVLLTSAPPLQQGGIEIVMYRIGEPLPPGILPVSPDLLFGQPGWPRPVGSQQFLGLARTSVPPKALTPTLTLPTRCATACAVKVTAPAVRRGSRRPKPARWVVGRGRAEPGARRVRLRLTPAGRKAVQRRSLRVRAQVRPAEGRARSFELRLERAGR